MLTSAETAVYRTGGVEVLTTDGKIKVVNTMESRLEIMNKQVHLHTIVYAQYYCRHQVYKPVSEAVANFDRTFSKTACRF